MELNKLSINGAWITHSKPIQDERGMLKEWFKFSKNFQLTGFKFHVAQSNYSKSKKGVIRGIHYSLNPKSQWKWISCVSGSIFDVVVDIRPNSPTFGRYESIVLDDTNGIGILIQASLGHAFQSLNKDSILVYNLNTEYEPQYDHIINPFDTSIDINWPLYNSVLSERDSNGDSLETKIKKNELPQ